eukprot:PITA_26029
MDVKSAFLNGVLKEVVYVAQPPSYEVEGKEDKVYWLRKVLYGLKQPPCAWLVGYTNSDWAGSFDDRKSTLAYVFHLGSGAILWASKKQPIISLSTAEDEYVAATAAACQAVWMRQMLRDLHRDQEGATTIFCDNTSTIALSKNSVFHKRTKHIDAKYHFIRELINNDEIVLQHCRSQE